MKKVLLVVALVLGVSLATNCFAAVSLVDICKTAQTVSAVKNAVAGGANVNETSADGTTALMAACQNSSISSTGIVSYLLASGADVTSVNSLGKSAIDYAKENTKYGKQIVALLEKAKTTANNAKTNINSTQTKVAEAANNIKESAQKTASSVKEDATKVNNELKEETKEVEASLQETKKEETTKSEGLLAKFKSWWNK